MSDPVRIIVGDCLEAMRGMDAASVDAIVTDPPYGLSFMGKHWDHGVPGVDFWIEALRVAKPGTHLLAFGGTRTYHRLACAIEDAGWEVRDCIAWVYGSGFPKSLDVSKAIDKAAGAVRKVVGISSVTGARHSRTMDDGNKGTRRIYQNDEPIVNSITAPATDLARQWSGWGTALKPAYEPIIVARKPLIGTVAENVTAHGTGALNIDGTRIGLNGDYKSKANGRPSLTGLGNKYDSARANQPDTQGRWPANLIHDGSDEVTSLLPMAMSASEKYGTRSSSTAIFGSGQKIQKTDARGGSGIGSAARFFYCAKASKRDRGEGNNHPTVKPTDLMRYLCRLVTPPGGIVLDPFAGSGSTGKGAVLEGFNFIGIELDAEYAEIARARIGNATSADKGLFA